MLTSRQLGKVALVAALGFPMAGHTDDLLNQISPANPASTTSPLNPGNALYPNGAASAPSTPSVTDVQAQERLNIATKITLGVGGLSCLYAIGTVVYVGLGIGMGYRLPMLKAPRRKKTGTRNLSMKRRVTRSKKV